MCAVELEREFFVPCPLLARAFTVLQFHFAARRDSRCADIDDKVSRHKFTLLCIDAFQHETPKLGLDDSRGRALLIAEFDSHSIISFGDASGEIERLVGCAST